MSRPAWQPTPAGPAPARVPAWRGPGLAAAAGLALIVAFVLRRFLAGGVFFRRDVHLVWHPQVEAFVRAVVSGSWPVWDPGPMFGQPLMADPSAMVLYPLTWLNLLLRPWTYYTVFVAAHLFFSAIGVWRLARRLEASPGAAFVSAAVWLATGPFLSLLDLWHHFAGAAWMPWVLLAADRALASRTLSRGLVWGAAMGIQILAGSADMCAMTGLVSLGLLVGHADRARWLGSGNRRLVLLAALAGALALALSAALWMTALDVAATSARASLPEHVRTYWSVHPLGLAGVFLPGFSQLPFSEQWRRALTESREPFLVSLYLGLPALGLVGAALAGPSHRARTLFAVVLVACVLVALGRHAPFYDAAVTVLPPLRILRYPVKAMVPAALAWAMLAGIGFDVWARAAGVARRRWTLAVLGPLAIAFALTAGGAILFAVNPGWVAARFLAPDPADAARPLRPATVSLAIGAILAGGALAAAVYRTRAMRLARPLAIALAALAVGDLLAVHRGIQPAAPRELYTHRPDVVEALRRVPHARIYAYDYSRAEAQARRQTPPGAGPLAREPQGWTMEAATALAMQMHLAPATAGRWNLPTAYDIDYRGLYPPDVGKLTFLLRASEGTPTHARLLRMGGVSHVVALHTDGLQDLRQVAEFPGLFHEPTRLLAVPGPQPRTYVVGAARVVLPRDAFVTLFDDLDPAREVLLTAGAATPAPAGFGGTSRVLAERADRVEIEATLSAPGYVVLLDSYAPGWRARVDGRDAPVLRANVLFRAVAVPAGTHRIEYVYRPRWMLAGLGVSAATVLGGAVAGAVAGRRARPSGLAEARA
jgi:hypothetical protein